MVNKGSLLKNPVVTLPSALPWEEVWFSRNSAFNWDKLFVFVVLDVDFNLVTSAVKNLQTSLQ